MYAWAFRASMGKISGRWLSSAELCEELAIGRRTLCRLKAASYFKEGHHYRKANPLSKRSSLLWNIDRVLIRMGVPTGQPPDQPGHAVEQSALDWRAPYGTYRKG